MYQNKPTQKNTKKGFTLVEMLVATAIFMSVMVIAVGALLTIISVNKKNQATKTVTDNVSFALDDMSRSMRTGTDYACLGGQDPALGCTGVQYIDAGGNEVFYRFLNTSDPLLTTGQGNVQQCIQSVNISCSPTVSNGWESMTAPTNIVNINNLKFFIYGDPNLNQQPRVFITLQGSVITKTGSSTFALQTTVSQRSR